MPNTLTDRGAVPSGALSNMEDEESIFEIIDEEENEEEKEEEEEEEEETEEKEEEEEQTFDEKIEELAKILEVEDLEEDLEDDLGDDQEEKLNILKSNDPLIKPILEKLNLNKVMETEFIKHASIIKQKMQKLQHIEQQISGLRRHVANNTYPKFLNKITSINVTTSAEFEDNEAIKKLIDDIKCQLLTTKSNVLQNTLEIKLTEEELTMRRIIKQKELTERMGTIQHHTPNLLFERLGMEPYKVMHIPGIKTGIEDFMRNVNTLLMKSKETKQQYVNSKRKKLEELRVKQQKLINETPVHTLIQQGINEAMVKWAREDKGSINRTHQKRKSKSYQQQKNMTVGQRKLPESEKSPIITVFPGGKRRIVNLTRNVETGKTSKRGDSRTKKPHHTHL